jgi:hypothetical protein
MHRIPFTSMIVRRAALVLPGLRARAAAVVVPITIQPSTESLGAADIPPIDDAGANVQLPVARSLVLEVFPRERTKYAPCLRLGCAWISRTSF